MSKKQWKKPELIILLKGRPEEAILAGCKGGVTAGPTAYDSLCVSILDACGVCSAKTST